MSKAPGRVPPTAPYKIVVANDFSECSARALEQAFALARRQPGAELHAVHVIDEADHVVRLPGAQARLEALVEKARDELSAATLRHLMAGESVKTVIHVRLGSPAMPIVSLANEIQADLILVGTHGRTGVKRFVLGSVSEKVARLAPCPVLVVRARDFSAMAGVPPVEPPCPACVAIRGTSGGKQWWCAEHDQPSERAHVYAYSSVLDPESPPGHML